MSLYEINISDVVKAQTIETLKASSYSSLKQTILDRKPLSSIINTIDTLLAQQTALDKDRFKLAAIDEACRKQQTDDTAEQQRDAKEESTDITSKSSLSAKLQRLSFEIETLTRNLTSQQARYSAIQSDLSIHQSSKSGIDQQLSSIAAQRNNIVLRYNVPLNHTHVHGHDHVHAHDQVHVHRNVTSFVYSVLDQAELSRLSMLESQLTAQQQSLSSQILIKLQMSQIERSNLDDINAQKKTKEAEFNKTERQLEIEIPDREIKRKVRERERSDRETARFTNDPNLMQLSSSSRESLEYTIRMHFKTLDGKRNELMDAASTLSYPVFLDQLEQILYSAHELNVTLPEKNALLMTIQCMKEYRKMQEEESRLNHNLIGLQTSLRKQEQSLRNIEEKYQRYYYSNPDLTTKNQLLTQQNSVLEEKARAAKGTANLYFTFSGLGAIGAVGGGLLIGFIFMNPLLFIIPGVFALVAVGTLIAALVYHNRESSNNNQVRENKNTIQNNGKQIEQQTQEMITFYHVTIPQLQSDIGSSQASIEKTQAQLGYHQQQMQFQFSKTERVTPIQQSLSGLFYSPSLPLPSEMSTTTLEASAPPMDPVTFGQPVTGDFGYPTLI